MRGRLPSRSEELQRLLPDIEGRAVPSKMRKYKPALLLIPADPSPLYHLVALLIMALQSHPALADDAYPARVVDISDGDTIVVLQVDKTRAKIRLSGIDAPGTGQDIGPRAKQAAWD
jgi:endonuclease YncB( thermonuclease family)